MAPAKMSGRERLRAALHNQPVDRIAWNPCVSPYYLMSHPRADSITQIEALREMGADILMRLAPASVTGFVDHPAVQTSIRVDGNESFTTIETPVGKLTSRSIVLPTSPWLPFAIERPVKTLQDLKVLLWIEEHRIWNPVRHYEEYERMAREIGDDGVLTESVASSPFRALMEGYLGIECLYDMLMTHPDVVEAWMDAYHSHHLRLYELVAEGPAEVVIGFENTSTTTTSPDMYRRYVKDRLDAYADIVRGASKVYLNHDCGTLMALADQIRDGHQNGRIDVARPPTGDFDFSRRRELTGDIVMIGGIDATAFVTLTPEEMKEHVREFLRSVAPGDCFILGSGDAIPQGTPPEVLAAVGELVAEEGAYPLAL